MLLCHRKLPCDTGCVLVLACVMVLACDSVSLCYCVSRCFGVSMCYGVILCYGVGPCHFTLAWGVMRPECPKDVVKRPEGPPVDSSQ